MSNDEQNTNFCQDCWKNSNVNGGNIDQSKYILGLLRENDRLQKENQLLKNYIVSTRNNATLKTAGVLTSILSWADDRFCQQHEDLFVKNSNKILENETQYVDVQERQPSSQNYEEAAAPCKINSYQTSPPSNRANVPQQLQKQFQYNVQGPSRDELSSTYWSGRPGDNQSNLMSPKPAGKQNEAPSLYAPRQLLASHINKKTIVTDNTFRPISPASQFSMNRKIDNRSSISQRTSPMAFIQYTDRITSIPNQQTSIQTRESKSKPEQMASQQLSNTIDSQREQIYKRSAVRIDENPFGQAPIFEPPRRIEDSIDQLPVTSISNPDHSYVTQIPQALTSPNMLAMNNAHENDWNSLIYQPPEIAVNSEKPKDQTKFGSSEGYASQLETEPFYSFQSDGRTRLGEPIGASTPIKVGGAFSQDNTLQEINASQKSQSQKISKSALFGTAISNKRSTCNTATSCPHPGLQSWFAIGCGESSRLVLHRPIDPVIGLKPVYSDIHRQRISRIRLSKRIIGEIAFQLDRRILEYVFAWKQSPESSKDKRRRYYGFSISNIGVMIRKEATDKSGKLNWRRELEMRYRFDYIIKTLSKFGYNLEKHAELSQDLVNKYGLLSGPPDQKTARDVGLDDPVILRILLNHLIKDDSLLVDVLVLLDCLCLLSYDDKRAIFLY